MLTQPSMMSTQLCLLFFIVSEAASLLHPRQLLPCQVFQNKANCSQLSLTSIPSNLPHGIQKLDLSFNFLQNLTEDNIISYPRIHHLHLHFNRIQYIQPGLFSNMTNLRVLNLSRNYLDLYAALKTDVGPLRTVQKLDLSGNGLYTDMSNYFLKDAPALLNLSLAGNSITKLDKHTFSGTLALTNIDLHNNVILDIEEGTFDSLLNLTELDLSMNSITCITDFNLFQLKSLNLSKNSMTTFQSIESEQEFKLLFLDLRENKIHYFPVLPLRNNIIYLDLSRNQLHSLNTTGAAEELEYLREREECTHCSSNGSKHNQELLKLLYMDLSCNQLTTVPPDFFSSLVALETLNVSNNCLNNFVVQSEHPLNALRTLDLSFNNLQNLTFEENTLQSLEILYLQGNFLKILNSEIFSNLPHIRNLHLQRNELNVCELQQDMSSGCLILNSIPTLQYLYLSENSLHSLPANAFQGSPLHILDLSLNPSINISKHALSGLESSLKYLSLSGNQIKKLNFDLSLLRSLKVVDLSSNFLSSLSMHSTSSAIETLNLQNNSLETLEAQTTKMLKSKLKFLYMGSNPLLCCENLHLISFLQQNSVEIPDIAMVTCQYTEGSENVEMNLSKVKIEHCKTQYNNVLLIVIITVLALGLMVVMLVAIKLCQSRSHRFTSSFKA